jgi:plastocyanin
MMRAAAASLPVVLALMAAGCGDDDSDDGGGGGSSDAPAQEESSGAEGNGADTTEAAGGGGASRLTLVADPGGALKFDKTELKAKAGEVTIVMENESDVPHAVEVEGNGVEEETDTVTGANSDLTVELEPGQYKFYCPVGNHAQAGMEGTLTVK